MSLSAIAVTGYIIWDLLLVIAIISYRTALTVSGKREANSFKPDGLDVSAFSGRLSRAHANCYESFPLIGGLLLLALATDSTMLTDSLAIVLLICRVLQSTTHLISTSATAVMIRFFFFVLQIVICFFWAFRLLQHFVS